MKRVKLSVIIPVYKSERFIKKCVRSIFSQTLDDIEYIFIDDNTPDHSIDIVKELASEYPSRQGNIKILCHDVNTGVGKARQDGLDASSGEYIINCDPDDYVEPDMYEVMYNAAVENDADLVLCDIIKESRSGITHWCQRPSGLSHLSVMSDIAKGDVYGSLWNKMIKRSTIISLGLKINEQLHLGEDLFFLMELLKNNVKICYVDSVSYHYNVSTNPNSLLRQVDRKDILQYELHISLINQILRDYPVQRDHIIAASLYHLFKIQDCSSKEFIEKYGEYEKCLINLTNTMKFFVKMAFKGYFRTFQNLYRLMKIFKKIKGRDIR